MMDWIKVKTRALTLEEQDLYPYTDYLWDMKTPEDREKVLVSDGKTVWTDFWIIYPVGSDFRETYFGEYEHLWWMPFPEPPSLEDTN